MREELVRKNEEGKTSVTKISEVMNHE